MPEYVNTLNHAVQVSSGAFVPAYETGEADPRDDHDAALIADGTLAETDKPKPRKAEEDK